MVPWFPSPSSCAYLSPRAISTIAHLNLLYSHAGHQHGTMWSCSHQGIGYFITDIWCKPTAVAPTTVTVAYVPGYGQAWLEGHALPVSSITIHLSESFLRLVLGWHDCMTCFTWREGFIIQIELLNAVILLQYKYSAVVTVTQKHCRGQTMVECLQLNVFAASWVESLPASIETEYFFVLGKKKLQRKYKRNSYKIVPLELIKIKKMMWNESGLVY